MPSLSHCHGRLFLNAVLVRQSRLPLRLSSTICTPRSSRQQISRLCSAESRPEHTLRQTLVPPGQLGAAEYTYRRLNLDLVGRQPCTDSFVLSKDLEETPTDEQDVSFRYSPDSKDKSWKFWENFCRDSIRGITGKLKSKYWLTVEESRALSALENSTA